MMAEPAGPRHPSAGRIGHALFGVKRTSLGLITSQSESRNIRDYTLDARPDCHVGSSLMDFSEGLTCGFGSGLATPLAWSRAFLGNSFFMASSVVQSFGCFFALGIGASQWHK